MRVGNTPKTRGPSRKITHAEQRAKAHPEDKITHAFLREIRAGFSHEGLRLDHATLSDLEMFSMVGNKSVFSMLDHTRTSYGQAFLWHLFENPLRDANAIQERQASVQFLVENPELRLELQGELSSLYDEVFSRDPRISVLEKLTRGREAPYFRFGKRPLAAFLPHTIFTLLGGVLPTSSVIYGFKLFLSQPLAETMSAMKNTEMSGMELLLTFFFVLIYAGGMDSYVREYLPDFKHKQRLIKASLIEANRLFHLAQQLDEQLSAREPAKLRSLASCFASAQDEADPLGTKSLVEGARAHVALNHWPSLSKNWWFRTIPLDFNLARKETQTGITSLVHALGDLDALCSQAEAAQKYGFGFAEIPEDQQAPLLIAKGLWHPFVEGPVPNDVALDDQNRFMVLSGPNGSGKSIILKATGLAVILAQTGGGGPFSSLQFTPFHSLITNINTIDDPAGGKSSFYTEKDRVQHMMEVARSGKPVFLGFDQIFMGNTNHLEAEATATGISAYIAQFPNARSVFATHLEDFPHWIEETTPAHITNHHLQAEINEDGLLKYLYKLVPGRSRLRATLQILTEGGFPREVLRVAEKMLDRLGRK
ncbi:MAG: hypothetical protein HQ596_05460 [Candidatus Saganbacteria bacterium]|nr:hypothetical protein [Candidatus Saganbacteria bacterium]